MQNKSAVILFTILLSLATLYVLSFNWVASNYEKQAEGLSTDSVDVLLEANLIKEDEAEKEIARLTKQSLADSADAIIYPVVDHTYNYVKEHELNLGLDLRGGMSVTLEVDIAELVLALSDNNTNATFRDALEQAKKSQLDSDDDFITLFEDAWTAQNSDLDLWRIFNSPETQDLFPPKSSNEEIFEILKGEAASALDNTEEILRKRIDQFGVAQPNIQKMPLTGRILVELPGVDDPVDVRKKLVATANLEFWPVKWNQEVAQLIFNANDALAKKRNPVLFAKADSLNKVAQETYLNLPDSLKEGAVNPLDQISAEDRDLLSPLFMGGKFSPNVGAQGQNFIGVAKSADLTAINKLLEDPAVIDAFGNNIKLMWSAEPQQGDLHYLYAVEDASGRGKAPLDGSSIIDARQGFDQVGKVIVNMTMDGKGTLIWADMTDKAAKDGQRCVAVTMDKKVFSAPSVNEAIENGRSQISFGSAGTLTDQQAEAQSLSGLLKAGSLPAPARIVDEVTVGPELGQQNIDRGLMSFIIALVVILAYMIFYYNGAGVVSNIALIANLFFLIGALASFGAALTLPGIAGIVLTIGMAVDANVLIYERIREEMRNGKSLSAAVKDGYSKAYSAIIDANLTTLLTAIILFIFGSGPIRGFAITLIIGIFTSLFSAIVITRLIFYSRLEKKKNITFSSKLTANWFTNMNFQFVKNRKKFYFISLAVILLGLASLFGFNHLNQGIDFTGGSTKDVVFASDVNVEQLKSDLAVAFTEGNQKGNPKVQTKGNNREIRITTNFMINSQAQDVDVLIQNAFKDGLDKQGIEYTEGRFNKVAGSISDDFRKGATRATIFSLIIIFLYITFRFTKWQFGVGALIAMVHDVLIVLGLFSLLWPIMPFSMEIDQAFIAAILTVIGYSINDTVVVFDRIREYLGLYGKKKGYEEVVNDALNSTLSRTINTSLSTFVVLLTIFILGGDNIKGFVFALMIGVVVGTYSSIFIATPSVVDFSKSGKK